MKGKHPERIHGPAAPWHLTAIEDLTKYPRGYDGERYVAAELDSLESRGFGIFHDFVVDRKPGGEKTNFNIDPSLPDHGAFLSLRRKPDVNRMIRCRAVEKTQTANGIHQILLVDGPPLNPAPRGFLPASGQRVTPRFRAGSGASLWLDGVPP